MTDRAGVVLAGGFARRFGDRDKTLAEFDGQPLITHAVEPLSAVVDRVVVSCRSEQVPAFETVLESVEYHPDLTPDEGPLAGLATALEGVDADLVAVTTADRPCVPSGLYRHLFESLDREGVVIHTEGIRQPAPAVFEGEPIRERAQAQRAAGVQRLRTVLGDLDLTTVPATRVRKRWGDRVLTDVNTQDDLDTLQSCK